MAEDRAYITGLALGYQMSQALFAALSLRLFTLLEEGIGDPEHLAGKAGADVPSVERLLKVLLDLKLVVQQGALYRNAAISSRYLVEGRKEYWGNTVHHAAHLWYFWGDLDLQIKNGRGKTPPRTYLEDYPHRLGDYLAAMNENAVAKAAAIAGAIEIHKFRHMLDMGCGPGSYGLAFCEMNPDLLVTMIDLEPSLALARDRVSASRYSGRITCHACQILDESIPGDGYDLVLVSNLIHLYGEKEVALILEKAWNILAPCGEIVIHDYLLRAGGRDRLYASLFDLTMLVGTPCGKCYRTDEVAALLRHLHADELREIPLELGTSLIVGKKTKAAAG